MPGAFSTPAANSKPAAKTQPAEKPQQPPATSKLGKISFLHFLLDEIFRDTHRWGCTDPGTKFLEPPDHGGSGTPNKMFLITSRVDGVLHAKFQLCRWNGAAAYREHPHSHLYYIDS